MTVAENVLKWGTGGINIDERVGLETEEILREVQNNVKIQAPNAPNNGWISRASITRSLPCQPNPRQQWRSKRVFPWDKERGKGKAGQLRHTKMAI